jgi:hypothetical protein
VGASSAQSTTNPPGLDQVTELEERVGQAGQVAVRVEVVGVDVGDDRDVGR